MEFSSIPWTTPGLRQVRANSCHTTGGSKIPGGALGAWGTFYFWREVWIDGTGGVTCTHMSHLLALVQPRICMCFFIRCFLQLLMNSLVVRVHQTKLLFISFIELQLPQIFPTLTSTWISPKVGNCQNLEKPMSLGITFIGKMLPTPCWCHAVGRCHPAIPSLHLRWFVRPPRCGMPRGGFLIGKVLGIFVLISTKHTKRKTYNQGPGR